MQEKPRPVLVLSSDLPKEKGTKFELPKPVHHNDKAQIPLFSDEKHTAA